MEKKIKNKNKKVDNCHVSFLTDRYGIPSSKRLMGMITVALGCAISLLAVCAALFYGYNNNGSFSFTIDIIRSLLVTGTGLLGIGIIDNKIK